MQKKLLILTGPTAVGKTNTAINLAKSLKTDIISCDSAQVYKYMDIGTAKPDEGERCGVVHHLIDYVDPAEKYTAARYKNDCDSVIDKLFCANKIPIMSGGTGLYINSVLYSMNLGSSYSDENLRAELEDIYRQKGADYLYQMLVEVDGESAKLLHQNDKNRVIRALEIYKLSGKTKSELRQDYKNNPNYRYTYVVLYIERSKLYDRINRRVDSMLEKGLIDEVEQLLKKGYDSSLPSMQAIGYKEIIAYLNGEMSKADALEKLKQNTRNYAKRQLTWFRSVKDAVWLNAEDKDIEHSVASLYYENSV